MPESLKPMYVLHHDDPPCQARLRAGSCPVCNLHPDTQNTAFWPYCPLCEIPLSKTLRCPACKKQYEKR